MDRNIRDIQTTIKGIICRELQIAPQVITDQSSLRQIPGIESLKFLRVILRVEEYYEIELEETVVFGVDTLNDIAVAVASCLEAENLQARQLSPVCDQKNLRLTQDQQATVSFIQPKTAGVGGGRCA